MTELNWRQEMQNSVWIFVIFLISDFGISHDLDDESYYWYVLHEEEPTQVNWPWKSI